MQVTVSDAKGQLTELVRRAESGEDIVLTRHGQPVARLTPTRHTPTETERREVLARMAVQARAKADSGASAERSQDFLYDGDGMPA